MISQPANSADKPIKVSINANELMFPKIRDVLNSTGKYVSLNLTGNALTAIPDNAFYDIKTRNGCESLVGITIPNSVNSIGASAFARCTSLSSIIIGNNVTSIGESAFYYCNSLTSITIPKSVTSIESGAFYCDITSITFQGTITDLGGFAAGDLVEKYLAGGIGTYTITGKDKYENPVWTKQ